MKADFGISEVRKTIGEEDMSKEVMGDPAAARSVNDGVNADNPSAHTHKRTNKRVMGLDYGSVTVGVAMTDALGITAQPVETITRPMENKLRRTLARIKELCDQFNVSVIVVGYPKNMNNTAGERAAAAEEFSHMVERRTGLPVVLWDERLTTVAADRALDDTGYSKQDRKKVIDQVAAVLILQSYLESH